MIDLRCTDPFSSALMSTIDEGRWMSLDSDWNVSGCAQANIVEHSPMKGERFQEWIRRRSRELMRVFLGVDNAFV
jgi:hypothetical protein